MGVVHGLYTGISNDIRHSYVVPSLPHVLIHVLQIENIDKTKIKFEYNILFSWQIWLVFMRATEFFFFKLPAKKIWDGWKVKTTYRIYQTNVLGYVMDISYSFLFSFHFASGLFLYHFYEKWCVFFHSFILTVCVRLCVFLSCKVVIKWSSTW